jgi:mannose-1-phosphate guanylyltransferase
LTLAPSAPALVLTAGLGTRLRPLTYVRAKPAVPIGGEPLVRRILQWLQQEGVTDAVLNLHHHPASITGVVGDGRDCGLRVRYSWERVLLGSAGGPRRALPLLDADRFFIVNGDTLTLLNARAMMAAHVASGARATLAVVPNEFPERYGGLLADEAGCVCGITRIGDLRSSFHFVGIQVVEASLFADLPDGVPAHVFGDLYLGLLAREPGSIRVFLSDAPFRDIGTPADCLATSLALAEAEGRPGTLPAGTGSRIDPSAHLVRTDVWTDVIIESGCELIDCIVADGVRVPAGSRFTRTVLVPAGSGPVCAWDRVAGDLLVSPLECDPVMQGPNVSS